MCIQVLLAAYAPVELDIALDSVLDEMAEDGKQRCNAGAAADQYHAGRMGCVRAISERAQRSFDGEQGCAHILVE